MRCFATRKIGGRLAFVLVEKKMYEVTVKKKHRSE